MREESESKDFDAREFQALLQLIRGNRALQARAESELPSEPLAAYLRGNATPDEVERIQEALAGSKELRDELLYAAGLYDPDTQAAFDKADPPETEATAPDTSQTKPRVPRGRARRSVPRWLWVLILATAAVLLFLVLGPELDVIP